MAARQKSKQINLLPQEEFAASILGRILRWGLTTFRFIVIITEIVVVGAFLSRFWLDARISDLNDLIRQKQAVIAASGEFEKDFRNTQTQLGIFTSITKEGVIASDVLETTSSLLPNDIYLSNFNFTQSEARIKGVAPSEQTIAQFIANLESVDNFKEISLTQLDSSEDNTDLLVFTLKIDLKKGEK